MKGSLYLRVDAPHEPVCCQEANSAHEQAVDGAGERGVSKKEQARHKARDVQPSDVEPGAIGEYPEGAGGADEEGLPPPEIVLSRRKNVSRINQETCILS